MDKKEKVYVLGLIVCLLVPCCYVSYLHGFNTRKEVQEVAVVAHSEALSPEEYAHNFVNSLMGALASISVYSKYTSYSLNYTITTASPEHQGIWGNENVVWLNYTIMETKK